MKTATLGQIRKVLELMENVSSEQVQAAFENGSLIRALKGTHIVDFVEFFTCSDALLISENFCDLVVSKSRPCSVSSQSKYAEVEQNMGGDEIEEFFIDYSGNDSNHLFDETEACAVIAGIVTRCEKEHKQGRPLS